MRIVNPDQEEYSGLVQLYKDDGNKKKISKNNTCNLLSIIELIFCKLTPSLDRGKCTNALPW
jgi:hypothetical protein